MTDDDPDGDRLTTSVELAQGTNPLRYDTDDDGWSDYEELNTTGTNPVLADTDGDGQSDTAEAAAGTNPLDNKSVFAIREATRTTGTFTLRWSAKAGKTYRVHRSTSPDFASFDVISPAVAGLEPLTTYTDTTVGLLNSRTAFYRVVTEP